MTRKTVILGLLSIMPAFLGVICEVKSGDCFDDRNCMEGESCSYWIDSSEGYCVGNVNYYCASDNRVYAADCYTYCGGTCKAHDDWGAVCDCPWTEGGMCYYDYDYYKAQCTGPDLNNDGTGDDLLYCSYNNKIGLINCYDYCERHFGSQLQDGYCGHDSSLGYNNCICVISKCDTSYTYCLDSKSIAWCDGGSLKRQTCDQYCQEHGQGDKGYCDYDSNRCECG